MDSKSSDEEQRLLIIIIDVNRVWWGEKSENHTTQPNGNEQLTLTDFIDAIITFSNAHLLLNHRNRLAIIASHANRSQYVYPPPDKQKAEENIGATADTLQLLKMAVKGELSHLLSEVDDRDLHAGSILAGALGMALCCVHKQRQALTAGEQMSARILVTKGTEDNSDQYMNFMNSVFTAQKLNVAIDACLFENDSGLLQQACDITHGIYLKIPQTSGLMQYLLWVFLPDIKTRSKMSMPPHLQVDYRAACFCHRQLIDQGYVCSVCLSIFCDFQAICSTCRVPFKILGGPVMRKKTKKML